MPKDACWFLLYTKPHAEAWAEINLRRQGFDTLLPRVRVRGATGPLFPRYVFAAYPEGTVTRSLHSTLGVQYVVMCGAEPARVPVSVIAELRSRMNSGGVVSLEQIDEGDQNPLLAKRRKERLFALERLAAAGFRVRAA